MCSRFARWWCWCLCWRSQWHVGSCRCSGSQSCGHKDCNLYRISTKINHQTGKPQLMTIWLCKTGMEKKRLCFCELKLGYKVTNGFLCYSVSFYSMSKLLVLGYTIVVVLTQQCLDFLTYCSLLILLSRCSMFIKYFCSRYLNFLATWQ